MLTKDYLGHIDRYTLIPGDNHLYTIADELLSPKKVTEVLIFDATGKTYERKLKYTK